MENIEVLDNFFSRYKRRTTLPSREEILADILKYECYSDNLIYSIDSARDNKKTIIYTSLNSEFTSEVLKTVPRLRISLCIPPNKRKDALLGLFGMTGNGETSFIVSASNKYSLDNVDLYFKDFQSFLNAYRYIRKFSGTEKYSKKRNPFALKINGVPCSVDFGLSENEFLDMYSSYIRLYLMKKLSDGEIETANKEEFKQFLITFASLNTHDADSCTYLSRILGLKITPYNIDKIRFITEEIIHSFDKDYSIDSFKKSYLKAKYLVGKDIDFYEGIDASLKKLICYNEETGTYDRNILSWLNRQLEFELDVIQSSNNRINLNNSFIVQEENFFSQLGVILISSKQTLLMYANNLKKVDKIKRKIIDLFNENNSVIESDKSYEEFVSNFSDEELLLIRNKLGYSSDFPSSSEQCKSVFRNYSGYVIADYKSKKEKKEIKK